MRKIFFILFSVLLLPVLMQAQLPLQAKGKVTDSLTGTSLKSATISFKNKAGSYFNEITAEDGSFSVTLPAEGVYSLDVNYTGYKPYHTDSLMINSQHTAVLHISVQLSALEKTLQGVTIVSNRQFITQTVDKITLDVGASPVAAGGNAYDVLLRAPGVIEQNNDLQFRGKSINVLINGRPSNMSGEDLKNYLTSLPANSIEKIEILPNPSAKYDAQGGSVINIKLAKNKNLGTNGTFTAGTGAGRFGRYNTGLMLNHRNKKVNVYGSYDFMHNGQYYDNSSNRVLSPALSITEKEYEVRYRNNHTAKLGMDYDISKKSSLGFLLNGSSNIRDRDLNNTSTLDYSAAVNDSFSRVFTTGFAKFNSLSANLYYRTILDSTGQELTVNGDYFVYDKNWNDQFLTRFYDEQKTEYGQPYQLTDNSPARNEVRSFSIDYVLPGKKNSWEAGSKATYTTTDNDVRWQYLDGSSWKNDITKSNHFIYKENIHAAYINYKRQYKKIGLQAGLRLERTNAKGESLTLDTVFNRNYTNLFPNIALQYTKSPVVQYGLTYRKSIQRFGFDIVNPFIVYQSQYSYYQGNPTIKPIIMHSIEFSHSWKYQLFTNLSYTYMKDAINMVYRQDNATKLLVNSMDNLSSADIFSGTVTWMKSFFKGKWTSTNTAGAFYMKYFSDRKDIQLNNAKLTGYVSTNNIFRFKKGLTGELSAFYRSPIATGVFLMKSYYSVNAGVSKEILKKKGSLKLNVTDAFNTQVIRYDVAYGDIKTAYRNKIESRYVNLVFTYKFGNAKVKAAKNRKTGIEEEKGRMGN